jgi:hypothetical protein
MYRLWASGPQTLGVPLYPWPPRNARQSDQAGVVDSALSPRAESRIRRRRCSVHYVGTALTAFTPSGRLSAQPRDGLPGLGRGARRHMPCRSRRRQRPRPSLRGRRAKPRGSRDRSPCTCHPPQCPLQPTVRRGALKSVDPRCHGLCTTPRRLCPILDVWRSKAQIGRDLPQRSGQVRPSPPQLRLSLAGSPTGTAGPFRTAATRSRASPTTPKVSVPTAQG